MRFSQHQQPTTATHSEVHAPVATYLVRTIHFLFHLLLLITPLLFTWVNEELFEFVKMLTVYGFAVSIVGCWILHAVVTQKFTLRKTPFDGVLLLFLLTQIISTVLSIEPRTSAFGYYTRFHGGLLSTIAYLSLYVAYVNMVGVKYLPRFLTTLFVSAALVALYAFPEHFGHSPSCALITSFQMFDVSCWIQDVQTRVFGTFGQPNWLAAFLITIVPVALSRLFRPAFSASITQAAAAHSQKHSSWLAPLGLLGLSTLLFVVLIFTQSRSGLIGLGGGMMVFGSAISWLTWSMRRQRSTTFGPFIKHGWRMFWTFMVIAGFSWLTVLVWFGSPLTPSWRQLTQPAPQSSPAPAAVASNRLETGGTESGEIRLIVWKGAIDVWKRYPWWGSGVETFAYSYYQDRPLAHNQVSEWDFLFNKAHNEFLNLLATTGIFGFLSYSFILVWFGWLAAKLIIRQQRSLTTTKTDIDAQAALDDALLAAGLLSGLVAQSIAHFFGFSTVMVTVLWYLYLAWLGQLWQRGQLTSYWLTYQSNRKKKSLSTGHAIMCTMVGVAIVLSFSRLYQTWRADVDFSQAKNAIQQGEINQGIQAFQMAIRRSPHEALFHSEFATTLSAIAVSLNQVGEVDQVSDFVQAALTENRQAHLLNDRHLNFYKSEARMYIQLSALDPSYLQAARDTLLKAHALAPTDAKIMYNLGLVMNSLADSQSAQSWLEQAVAAKPDYYAAQLELARVYQQEKQWEKAQKSYQRLLEIGDPENLEIQQHIETLNASISSQPIPNKAK